jgi:hypothetical protein
VTFHTYYVSSRCDHLSLLAMVSASGSLYVQDWNTKFRASLCCWRVSFWKRVHSGSLTIHQHQTFKRWFYRLEALESYWHLVRVYDCDKVLVWLRSFVRSRLSYSRLSSAPRLLDLLFEPPWNLALLEVVALLRYLHIVRRNIGNLVKQTACAVFISWHLDFSTTSEDPVWAPWDRSSSQKMSRETHLPVLEVWLPDCLG